MLKRTALILSALVLSGSARRPAPVGVFDISGLENVRLSLAAIDFGPLGGGVGGLVVTGVTEDFVVLPLGSAGAIADLDLIVAPPGAPLAVPIDPFVSVPRPDAVFSFSLEEILIRGGPPCTVLPAIGESCTPSEIVPTSPLLFTQTATGVTARLAGQGTVTSSLDPTSTPFLIFFTFNVIPDTAGTVAEVLAAMAPGGLGFVESSWSAELSPGGAGEDGTGQVPEPASLGLPGVGLLLGISAGRVRRRLRSASFRPEA